MLSLAVDMKTPSARRMLASCETFWPEHTLIPVQGFALVRFGPAFLVFGMQTRQYLKPSCCNSLFPRKKGGKQSTNESIQLKVFTFTLDFEILNLEKLRSPTHRRRQCMSCECCEEDTHRVSSVFI